MNAVTLFQVVATLFFALGRFVLPLLPSLLFGLSIAYAVQHDVRTESAAQLFKALEEMLAAKDETQQAQGELAKQKKAFTELRSTLGKATRYITYISDKAGRYRAYATELERKAKQDTETLRRALAAATTEMKAAQDLARLVNSENIDLKRRVAKLELDLSDARDERDFAKEELDATVYMHELQMLDLLEELQELRDEREQGRQCCLDDWDEHAEGEMEGSESFSPDDLACPLEAHAQRHDSPDDEEEEISLEEVRAYWQGVRQELQQAPDAQPNPPPSTTPLATSPSSLATSNSFQGRSASRPVLFLPMLTEFAECPPLLLLD